MPSKALRCDGILEPRLGRVQIVDDGRLVPGVYAADELGHGVIENNSGIVHRLDIVGDAAVGRRSKCISRGEHIAAHVRRVLHQNVRRAIDEIRVPGLQSGDQFPRSRSLHAIEREFIIEASGKQASLSGRISIRVRGERLDVAYELLDIRRVRIGAGERLRAPGERIRVRDELQESGGLRARIWEGRWRSEEI